MGDAAGSGGEDEPLCTGASGGELVAAVSIGTSIAAAEAAAASTPAPLIPWHMNFSAEEAVRSRRKFPRRARR
jgi:hypothetical protein